jgi:hypothetical protein
VPPRSIRPSTSVNARHILSGLVLGAPGARDSHPPIYRIKNVHAIDATVRMVRNVMAGDFQGVFGDRYVALVASPGGAARGVRRSPVATDDLQSLGHSPTRGGGRGRAVPLVMTTGRIYALTRLRFRSNTSRCSTSHVVIAAHPPSRACGVPADDLRRACEVRHGGTLIHSARVDRTGLASWRSRPPARGFLKSPGADAHEPARSARRSRRRRGALAPGRIGRSAAGSAGADVLSHTDAPHRSAAPRGQDAGMVPRRCDVCGLHDSGGGSGPSWAPRKPDDKARPHCCRVL